MEFFDRLFGKKPAANAPGPMDEEEFEDEDIQSTGTPPIQEPPEFVRAVELQRAYWTHNAGEQAELEARGVEQLSWRERLRLHHLICLQRRLCTGPERAIATEKCRQTVRQLITPDSPYRPRPAMIWQEQPVQPGSDREPDMQGELLNQSLTHIGCLEIYRLDAADQPTGIDFVGFDELSRVVFAPYAVIRAAKLYYGDRRGEVVFIPMLYGLTWAIGNKYDRAGTMTRFVSHLDGEEVGTRGALGMGVGQQDFSIRSQDGGGGMFGLGSLGEISFPLDTRDPRFDEKARALGIDADWARRQVG